MSDAMTRSAQPQQPADADEDRIKDLTMDDKRPFWINLAAIVLVPIICMVLGIGIAVLLDLSLAAHIDLIVNLFFLAAGVGLWRALAYSREDMGLQVIKQSTRRHGILSLVVFGLYGLFYLLVIRISSLKPFSSTSAWGLLAYLVLALAEELYFRGLLYRVFEKRFSARTALIATSLLFGFFQMRQGLRGILLRTFSGWLRGSVRYSSGMIFLLIFPIHLMYNAVWLLLEANWSNLPAWAIYALPAVEYLIGLAFVIVHDAGKKDQNSED